MTRTTPSVSSTEVRIPLDMGGLVRVVPPARPTPRAFVLLHGWTGDEYALQPIAAALPPGWRAFFRAPFPVPPGTAPRGRTGFSWLPADRVRGSTVDDYRAAAAVVQHGLQVLRGRFPQANWEQPLWVGFSQGAATAAVVGLRHPARVAAYAGLVGYLPRDADALVAGRPWQDKPVFVAHGRRDPLISVERAEHMVALLTQAGARLTRCWADAGHKMTQPCLQRLSAWARQVVAAD